MSDYYLIAEIKAVSENDGFVSLHSYSDSVKRFSNLKDVFIDVFGDKRLFVVEYCILNGKNIYLKFKNFNSDKDVMFLIGKCIYIKSENLRKLSDNEFFVHDLIGSSVYQAADCMGELIDIMVLPCHDVYIVKRQNKSNLLIPAVKEFISSFDKMNKTLHLQPDVDLSGLDEN